MRLTTKIHFLGKLLIVLCLLFGCGFIYLSPFGQSVKNVLNTAWQSVINRAHWNLSQVIVMGANHTDKAQILSAIQVQQHQPMNTIDLDQSRSALLKLPWIKEVIIERYLPNSLVIQVTEKTPVALWQNQGVYWPLDELGQPIYDNQSLSQELILVVGSDVPEHVLELLQSLEQVPHINQQVASATRVENRRWNLRLYDAENGLKVMLPQHNVLAALKRLEKKDQQEKLLKKDIAAIDIRLDDRIILHPKKSPQKKRKK